MTHYFSYTIYFVITVFCISTFGELLSTHNHNNPFPKTDYSIVEKSDKKRSTTTTTTTKTITTTTVSTTYRTKRQTHDTVADDNDSGGDELGIEIVNATVELANSSSSTVVRVVISTGTNHHQHHQHAGTPSTTTTDGRANALQYNERVVRELCDHFAISEPSVISLGALLLRMKEIAYDKTYGQRNFGHDSDLDKDKELSTSGIQPNTKPEIAPFLFEGDILLNENQATAILTHLQRERPSRSLSSDPDAIWRQRPIRFRFHDSLEFFAITQIVEAIRYWEDNTCLHFAHVQEKLAEADDHIEFFKGQGCYSMIGRYGGRQGISIGSGCERTGIVEHEIGHTLGLWHEQSRPDAGKYVDVKKEFIIPSYMSDFQRRGTDEIITLGIPYDYGSVMHYGPTAFSADGFSLTLITKNTFYQSTIGQREKLSFYDIQIINKAYCIDKCNAAKSGERPKFVAKCTNGGYPHPSNCSRCICPTGYGGDDCSTFQPPKNAECGGILNVNFADWRDVKSPGYDADGYEEDQRCSWIVRAPKTARVQVEFVDEFSFLCSSICQDFVELKLAGDQRATGARFCCDLRPEERFVSESNQMAIIFRSQASQDRGFYLRIRATYDSPILQQIAVTEAPPTATTTVAGANVWSAWGEWSACSRSCGGCGIRSRIRACLSAQCENKNQEFGACNFEACPVKADCDKILYLNRICRRDVSSAVCSNLSSRLSECHRPSCCPPFYAADGKCVTSQFNPTASITEI